MSNCEEIRTQIDCYLDDELQPPERAEFEQHLMKCAACRSALLEQQDIVSEVRHVGPLYDASDSLRERMASLVIESESRVPAGRSRTFRYTGAALVAVSLALLAWVAGFGIYDSRTAVKATSELGSVAANTHLQHEKGALPFEIASTSPEEISKWFTGKLSFALKLPNYQESSGQERLYELRGARLVAVKNDYAAYVGYQMRQHSISLLVTSATAVQPQGGELISSRGLTFHFESIAGLKVITWTDRGLSYALVSDLEERGQESCIVCHQGTRDRDFIEGFKPLAADIR